MGLVKEFKEFALKGNIVELAVAVIIGVAFGAIISSMVDDVITPLILTPALKAAQIEDIDKVVWGAVKIGKFLSAIIKFFIIAVSLFAVIKAINSTKKVEEAAPPAPPAEPSSTDKLLIEIRDALRK